MLRWIEFSIVCTHRPSGPEIAADKKALMLRDVFLIEGGV